MMGLFRAIPSTAAIASHFSTESSIYELDHPGNLSLIKSCFHQCINLVSLFLAKLRLVAHLCSSFLGQLEKHKPTAAYLLCQLRRVALET